MDQRTADSVPLRFLRRDRLRILPPRLKDRVRRATGGRMNGMRGCHACGKEAGVVRRQNAQRVGISDMTTNQRRAAVLAEQIFLGARSPEALPDNDWSLLLLAAGTNAVAAPAAVVSRRVLEYANQGSGYFWHVAPRVVHHAGAG